jgi:glycosyltransferase involved in cell wall biosynthesis
MILPLGFDDKLFNKNYRSENKSKFIISYFGKIESKKGVHTLLKALNLLNFDDWIFSLDLFEVNNLGYFRSIKSDLIKLKQKNKLKLIKCNHNNINQFMKLSDLTIVPSEWNEQYGRVIQESAACGSVVIGSNIGAIPEILINTDFVFMPNDILSLKNKIEDIYFNYNNYRTKFDLIENYINLNRTIDAQAKLISKINY